MTRQAIILAGGRGTRLGGTSKADIVLDGSTLLDRLLLALDQSNCTRQVCVGPPSLDVPDTVILTCEKPAEGGPAAGIVWGMDALGLLDTPTGTVAVVSVDAPGAETAISRLFEAIDADSSADVAMLVDRAGNYHHLIAVYRATSLAQRIRALALQMPSDNGPWFAGIRNIAAKRLVQNLHAVGVSERVGISPESRDIDTPDDLNAWSATIK